MNGQAGKGDSYRKVDPAKWAENYDRIFRRKVKHAPPKRHIVRRLTTWSPR
jgi:hypothetical protein